MRYRSIDFFRGLTVAFMLIVNNPGTWSQIFTPLGHAEWHGCTPTDLVFPSFLFIVGASMFFSFVKQGDVPKSALLLKILRRTAILFMIGMLLNWFPFDKTFEKLRILGVLQRIALSYGLAATLVVLVPPRVLAGIAVAILLGYWGALFYGGMEGFDPYGAATNLVRRIDLALLGDAHLWKGKGFPFDPEGLLSTLPAVVTVLIGYWAGSMIYRYRLDGMRVVYQLLLWGNILATIGCIWDLVFPINKALWTSSYVLYAGGVAMLLLAFCVWIIDVVLVKGTNRIGQGVTWFFEVFGSNALVAFVLSGLLAKILQNVIKFGGTNAYKWLYTSVFQRIEPYKFGSLLFALTFMLACWGVCLILWKRRIFVKI
jgi:predicted acyltransferase